MLSVSAPGVTPAAEDADAAAMARTVNDAAAELATRAAYLLVRNGHGPCRVILLSAGRQRLTG